MCVCVFLCVCTVSCLQWHSFGGEGEAGVRAARQLVLRTALSCYCQGMGQAMSGRREQRGKGEGVEDRFHGGHACAL